MNMLPSPLTDDEIDLLDDFLLNRIGDDEDTLDKDEGIFEVSGLDGFLTAVVSGPVMIPPSKWMASVWGDFEPVWESEQEFSTVFSLIMRHMNGIGSTLIDPAEDLDPMFYSRVVDDQTYIIPDEWCEGYSRGVDLVAAEWKRGGQKIDTLLAPILAFTEKMSWPAHDLKQSERVELHKNIESNVQKIHAYWLSRRDEFDTSATAPMRRSEPRVGRNDPCPCGSGRKYKKCCLQ